jgi:hypothetical protein
MLHEIRTVPREQPKLGNKIEPSTEPHRMIAIAFAVIGLHFRLCLQTAAFHQAK